MTPPLLILCPLSIESRAARRARIPRAHITTIGPGPDRVLKLASPIARFKEFIPEMPGVILFGLAGAIRPLEIARSSAASTASAAHRAPTVTPSSSPANSLIGSAAHTSAPFAAPLPHATASSAAFISRVIDAQTGEVFTPTLPAPHGVPSRTILGSDIILSTPRDKADAARRFPAAELVDTESHAFAKLMTSMNIPWAIVRGVSDRHDESLPPEAANWISRGGRTRIHRVLWDLLLNPSLSATLRTLNARSTAALNDASAVLRAVCGRS